MISGDAIDLNRICNVVWHQYDGGPFPGTLGVSVTKDPDDGLLNAGIYRMGTLAKNRLGWGAPKYTHGRQHYMKYEKRGEPMPMAVITGYDPIVFTVSCTRTPPNVDEFHIAGALRGEPLEMVRCKTIDIEVPATSEVVFEGYIQPGERHMEGGFGEYTGYYGEARSNPVFEVTAITHRKNPQFLGAPGTVVSFRQQHRRCQSCPGGSLQNPQKFGSGSDRSALRCHLRGHCKN